MHRKYDFCFTCCGEDAGAEAVLQSVYNSVSKWGPALNTARNQGDKMITVPQQRTQQIRDSFNLAIVVTKGCFSNESSSALL